MLFWVDFTKAASNSTVAMRLLPIEYSIYKDTKSIIKVKGSNLYTLRLIDFPMYWYPVSLLPCGCARH